MRLVFAGTPDPAVVALEALLASRHQVVAVVTRPDAPAGRGRHLEASPVAQLAESAGLEVLKPVKARDPEFLDRLRAIGPDCCPVTAYGALLPQVALDIPVHGWVNLHFSVLPAWRGAAPVQHALLHGDDVTGATTFQIVKELDAGPVFGVLTEPVGPRDTGWPCPAPGCWSTRWTASSPVRYGRSRSPRKASATRPRSTPRTPGSTGGCRRWPSTG
jgi:methionyl-tRNA formyltransferase